MPGTFILSEKIALQGVPSEPVSMPKQSISHREPLEVTTPKASSG